MLENTQDPGNLGTIIRMADAFGLTAVIVSPTTCDPYNDKVIRATMGSVWHIPVVRKTMDECFTAWHGYVDHVPRRNLEAILDLRGKGYKVCLLSNTNPFMMQWANRDFDGQGHSIGYFFDALYLSYECKVMKPRREIFDIMLRGQQSQPGETLFIDDGPRNVEVAAAMGMHTLCPHNNEDWIAPLHALLAKG